ncbi:MAG: DNA primase [Planctomycetia bacterium]
MLDDDFKRALEAIKNRAPIEDVVRERVPTLRKAGALWQACCPFHDERTPSFKVDPRRGTWHCYGSCGTGGDQISFLERIDNLSFIEAVEILAARTGVELPRKKRVDPAVKEGERRQRAALEAAASFYKKSLHSQEGRRAADYLSGRGLGATTGDVFGVGYAPAAGTALCEHLRAQGHEFEVLEAAGLARRNDSGRAYDFFRGRLMIPIRDVEGGVLGFGGRRLSDDDEAGPKYVNTPETELFKKGRLIYAWDRALKEVRKCGRVALVEGYTDVMAAHQVGVPFVAAVLGTSTTEDHAALVRRSGARVVQLVFDGDNAGRKAAFKALHGLLPLELELQVAVLAGGDDPCDICVREGAPGFLARLDTAVHWFTFLLDGLRDRRGMELSQEVDRVLALLTRIKKPVLRQSLIADLAQAIDMPVAALREQYQALPEVGRERQLERLPRPAPAGAPGVARTVQGGRVELQRPAASASAQGESPASVGGAVAATGGQTSGSAPAALRAAAVLRPLQAKPKQEAVYADILAGLLHRPEHLPQVVHQARLAPDAELGHLLVVLESLYHQGTLVADPAQAEGVDLGRLLAALADHPVRHKVLALWERGAAAEDPQALLNGALKAYYKSGLDAEQARILTRVKELDGVPGASDEIGPLAARLREIQALIREVR